MTNDRCPWCGAEEKARHAKFTNFACGTLVSGVDHRRYESCYENERTQLVARVAALESALQTIADTHGPGTLAGDAAREGLKR